VNNPAAPKRVMLDTNVYDLIVARRGFTEHLNAAVEAGAIEILRTRVQDEEIARIPDAARRAAMRKVRSRAIPTSEAAWTGLPKGHAPSEDALIAATALESADVLVSEDRTLRSLVAGRIEAWRFAELVAYVDSLPAKRL
jgi:predicted nucleic acid-binding protein